MKLTYKYILVYFLLLVYSPFNLCSQCSGSLIGYFPATVNGITITEDTAGAVGWGSPNPADTYTYCGVVSRTLSLGASTSPLSFTQTLNFSDSVNDIIYILTASDSVSYAVETFSFTINSGILNCTQNGSTCLFTQIGNFFRANSNNSIGISNSAYITLHSTKPYTSLTVTGPGGANGSFMSLCAASVTTGINNLKDNIDLYIYPNPNNGSFTINYTGIAKQVSIEIYNIMGQQVLSQTYTQVTSIPVNGLTEGVYFVKVSADNTLLKTSKIVVTK